MKVISSRFEWGAKDMGQVDLSALAGIIRREGLAVRGVRVFQDGQLAASYQPEPERRQNLFSGTKSFTGTAVGIAVQEGLFTLDDFVLDHFREDAPAHPSEKLERMRLRHLITMSMGFGAPMLDSAMRRELQGVDWVRHVLAAEVVHEPGTVFQYNNAGPYLLGVLIQRRADMTLREYLEPRLFGPLGISGPEYGQDPQGCDFGASGMRLTVSEFSKLGLLYLQKGRWNGAQLVSQEWVEAASSPQIRTGTGDNELGYHYGYQFWIMPGGMYRADGVHG